MADKPKYLRKGEVEIEIDDKKYVWERPKAKDYLELNEMAIRMAEKLPVAEGLPTEDEIDQAKDEEAMDNLKKVNDVRVSLTATTLEICQAWFFRGMELLSKEPFEGTVEDIPIWAMNGEVIGEILNHWISDPSVALGS